MCNALKMRIKSVSPAGIKTGWLPCSKCQDCRLANRADWIFRLRVELDELSKKYWKIGFFTLTYNDDNLPLMPIWLFKDSTQYRRVPCFKRADISTFFDDLRQWCKREYGCRRYRVNDTVLDLAPRMMICAEYGEHTQRPHYHGIVCFPPAIPDVAMFNKVHELWNKGFVFPKDFDGGYDSHGYEHKPFICNSVKAAAVYAAKYVCKDIAYLDFIKDIDFHKDCKISRRDIVEEDSLDVNFDWLSGSCSLSTSRRLVRKKIGEYVTYKLKDFLPFHIQSRGIGKSFLDGKTDVEKLSLIKDGWSFIGEDRRSKLPRYLREKILFHPRYIVDEKGRRLVRKECNEFFFDHYCKLFDFKREAFALELQDFFRLADKSSVESEFRMLLENPLNGLSFDMLSGLYNAFFGVAYKQCYDLPHHVQWARRYDFEHFDVTNVDLISYDDWRNIQDFFNVYFYITSKLALSRAAIKERDERDINRIHDFWLSME